MSCRGQPQRSIIWSCGKRDYLKQIRGESVPVLVEEPPGVVEHDPGEVVEPERGVDVRLGLQVVGVVAVTSVQLVQHRLVSALETKQYEINLRHRVTV